MKTRIFYIAIAMIAIVSCSEQNIDDLNPMLEFVTITDANFEELLISDGIDSDGIVNQQMLKSDAEKVTKLSLYDANIYSLDGIEAFVNLKRLEADANNLTVLDLSANVLLDTISLTLILILGFFAISSPNICK